MTISNDWFRTRAPYGVLLALLIFGATSTLAAGDGFLANNGRLDADVLFYGTSNALDIFFTAEGVMFDVKDPASLDALRAYTRSDDDNLPVPSRRGHAVQLSFHGHHRGASLEADDAGQARHNFFLGNEAHTWKTDQSSYRTLVYRNLWDGVDLEFSLLQDGRLEYRLLGDDDATASARTNLVWKGAESVQSVAGGTEIATSYGSLVDGGGRIGTLRSDEDDLVFAMNGAGALLWSTLAGGTGDDEGSTLAVASNGDVFMAGETTSPDYPGTPGAYDETYGNFTDIFVNRFSNEGATLVWSTYIGTSNHDYCNAMVLDANDNPIFAGRSSSSSYPTTAGAYDTSFNGGVGDATLTKLSSDGSSLIFSTYLGGSEVDSFFDIALDADGDIVCAGYTASSDYPTSAGAYQNTFAGPPYDYIVSTISADGTTLQASTYVGGTNRDACRGVAVDDAGDIYLAGFSFSSDFPATGGTFQSVKSLIDDATLSKMSGDLTQILWSSYIGGNDSERALAVDLDSAGNPVIAGFTYSTDFPTTPGALQETVRSSMESFVAKFRAGDGSREWSTYVGGLHVDEIVSVQLDANDNPLITGWTTSPNFHVNDLGYDNTHNGGEDIFVSRLSADGTALLWGTYLGDSGDDRAMEVAIDAHDNPLVAGTTGSSGFPTSAWAYGENHRGGMDAVLARFDTGDAALTPSTDNPQIGCGTTSIATFSFTPSPPHTPALRGYSVRVLASEGLTFAAEDISVQSPMVGVNDTFQIIEHAPGDMTIDFSFLEQGEGLSVAADLFTVNVTGTAEGIGTVSLADGIFRDVNNHPFDVDTIETLDLMVDCDPPVAPLLDPEPAYTMGTENTLTWADGSGGDAVSFNAQASTLEDFSVVDQESGFIPDLSHTFVGLADSTTYHYRVLARDEVDQISPAGNVESSTQDATAPESAVEALPAASPTTFAVSFTAVDGGSGTNTVELFYNFEGGAFNSAGVHTASPISFTANDGDGLYGFYTVATDSVGNIEASPAVPDATTQVDTTAPITPTMVAEPAFTAADSNTVACSDEAASGAVTYNFQISETADFSVLSGESGAIAESSFTFHGLIDGGTYYYRVAAIDALGNASGFSVVVASTQDAAAPVSEAGALPPQGAPTFDVAFSAMDAGSGVETVELFFNFDGGAFTSFGSFGVSPIAFTAANGEGTYGFYTVATDSLSNIESDPAAAQSTCLLDLTAPVSAVDSLATFQTSGVFTLTATAADNLTGIASYEWFYSLDAGDWISAGTSTEASFLFTAPADGAFGFYSVATDSAGHTEAAPSAADALTTVDTNGPTGLFVINDGASATNDSTVTLRMTIGGAVEMRFSNDNLTFPFGWVAYDTTATWTLVPVPGEHTVYGEFRDDAGNPLAFSDSIVYDLDATGAVSFLSLTPAHEAVQMSWHDPDDTDLDHIEIWRGLRHDGAGASAYPAYDGAILPEAVSDRAAALASADWELAGTAPAAAEAFNDTIGTRGIYHYELFAVDVAGNFSAPFGALPAATNYILGDMLVPFDGDVDVADLTALGATYGLMATDDGFDGHGDVGPTDDFSGQGLPLADGIINFDDLMIATNNYGPAGRSGAGVKNDDRNGGPVQLTWRQTADRQFTLSLESDDQALVGLNLKANLPAGSDIQIRPGALLAEQEGIIFLRNIPANGLDLGCALLGQRGGFIGTGELLSVVFGADVPLAELQAEAIDIELRNAANQPLESTFAATSAVTTPRVFALEGNYPNPFNPQTSIRFSLPQAEQVQLEIYSIAGRRVTTLVNSTYEAGPHEVIWTGRDDSGQTVASGVYFYRLRAGEFSDVRKMTLMK